MVTEKEVKTIQVKRRTYRVVNSVLDVPMGYVIWNIGRHNFPLEGYVPMCRANQDFSIDVTTLCAVPCKSEEQALEIMKNSMRKGTITAYDLIAKYKLDNV